MNSFSTNSLYLNTGIITYTGNHIYCDGIPILNSGDIANNYYLNSNPSGFITGIKTAISITGSDILNNLTIIPTGNVLFTLLNGVLYISGSENTSSSLSYNLLAPIYF